jgi:hypothetical protein
MAKSAADGGARLILGAGGEYQPRCVSLDRYDAQRRFFAVLAQVEPRVFNDLRAVFKAVRRKPELWHYPIVPNALREWGERWHLADDWCLALAREYFAVWEAEYREERLIVSDKTHSFEAMVLGISAWPGIVLGTAKIDSNNDEPPRESFNGIGPVSIPGWFVLNETEDAFRKRAVQQFKLELEAYIQRSHTEATGRNLVKTAAVRELEKHLTWLARVVAEGVRPTDIWKSLGPKGVRGGGQKTVATRGGLTRRAVEKALSNTASLIGLNRPKNHPASTPRPGRSFGARLVCALPQFKLRRR